MANNLQNIQDIADLVGIKCKVLTDTHRMIDVKITGHRLEVDDKPPYKANLFILSEPDKRHKLLDEDVNDLQDVGYELSAFTF